MSTHYLGKWWLFTSKFKEGKVSNWAKSLSLSPPLLFHPSFILLCFHMVFHSSLLFMPNLKIVHFQVHVHHYKLETSRLLSYYYYYYYININFVLFVCFVCDHVLTLPNHETPHYIFGTMEGIFNEAMCTMIVS